MAFLFLSQSVSASSEVAIHSDDYFGVGRTKSLTAPTSKKPLEWAMKVPAVVATEAGYQEHPFTSKNKPYGKATLTFSPCELASRGLLLSDDTK